MARSNPFPERVGRYEILLPIASGGMATVYLGRSRGVGGFEREVALKLTHSHLGESREFAAELVEEAKLSARIRHPNVVPVLDVGDDPHGLFLVMEYVEGDTLAGLIRRALAAGDRLDPRIAMRILCDSLAGLDAAHELRDDAGRPLGIVHRDFSPQNVLVGVDGMSRLADFGIAKASSRLSYTRTGSIKGKIAYMSPEQARAQPVDRRADIWAAGVVAWELLAGRRLHLGDNEVALLLRIVTTPAESLVQIRADVPQQLDRVVARALAIDPAARWPTAAEFSQALSAACREVGWPLADIGEVGAYVKRQVGAKLATRRVKAAEVAELRERVGAAARVTQDSLTPPSSPGLFERPPSAPTARLAGDAAASAHARDRAPAALAQWGQGHAALGPSVEQTATLRETAVTETSSITSSPALQTLAIRLARQRRTKVTIALVAAAALLGVAMAAMWWRESPPGAADMEPSASAGEPPASSSTDGRDADDGVPQSVATSRAAASASAAQKVELVLTSNAPVASVRINGARTVTFSAPAQAARLEVSPEELAEGLRLELRASDGRRVVQRVAPGSKDALIVFPAARAPTPLATSPYGKKR